jgi:hypothetical protein
MFCIEYFVTNVRVKEIYASKYDVRKLERIYNNLELKKD